MNNIFNTIFILILSFIPSIIMFVLILNSDRKSKEPFFLMILCLISGIFTITLAIFIQNILVNSIINNETLSITSSIEEYCKLLVLYIFFSHLKSFDDIYDGFVYSTIICRNRNYYICTYKVTLVEQSLLALTRTFTAIPLHLICGIVMGYYIGLKKFSKKKKI